jgi:hypothetical protein
MHCVGYVAWTREQSREDLIQALVCSCHIPFWTSPWPLKRVRGGLGADGYLSNVATFGCPPTQAPTTVCVCPFRSSYVFAKRVLPDGRQARGFGRDVISPEVGGKTSAGKGEPGRLLSYALNPPKGNKDYHVYRELREDGRIDARRWMMMQARVAAAQPDALDTA